MRVDRPRDDHTDSPSTARAGRECFEVPSESSAGATTSIHARSLASTSHRESRDAALRPVPGTPPRLQRKGRQGSQESLSGRADHSVSIEGLFLPRPWSRRSSQCTLTLLDRPHHHSTVRCEAMWMAWQDTEVHREKPRRFPMPGSGGDDCVRFGGAFPPRACDWLHTGC